MRIQKTLKNQGAEIIKEIIEETLPTWLSELEGHTFELSTMIQGRPHQGNYN